MPKLIIVAVGLVFAVIGYRKTWYPSWAFLFNVLIAVYVSIMITPQVVDRFDYIRSYLDGYSYAAFALTVTAVIFAVMHLLSFRYFTTVANISFPKIFNSVGAAVLGFLAGSVIAGFLLFLVTITPLSKFSVVKNFMQDKPTADCLNVNCAVLSSCNFVHSISLQPVPDGPEKQLELILADWNKPAEKMEDANNSSLGNIVETIQTPIPAGARTKKIDKVMTELERPAGVKDANSSSDSNLIKNPQAVDTNIEESR